MPTLRHSLLAVLIALLLACPGRAVAGIRPSFSLPDCAAAATDIIVVEENGAPGPSLTVLETWKGNLKKGRTFTLPGLPAARTLADISKAARAGGLRGGADPQNLPAFTGHRIVLFLKPNPFPASDPNGESPLVAVMTDDRPQSADRHPEKDEGVARACAVWIEGDRPFSFVQVVNPGPSVLTPVDDSEAKFKAAILVILAAQEQLRTAAASPDTVQRARRIEPFLKNENQRVRRDALSAIATCGPAALPMLRPLLLDPMCDQVRLVEAIFATAGPDGCTELTSILTDELAYWKKTAPTLAVGWRNDIPAADIPRQHFKLLAGGLDKLATNDCDPARDPITQIRALWVSLPQLNDTTGPNQIIAACDAALAHTPTPSIPPPQK